MATRAQLRLPGRELLPRRGAQRLQCGVIVHRADLHVTIHHHAE